MGVGETVGEVVVIGECGGWSWLVLVLMVGVAGGMSRSGGNRDVS